MDVRKNAIHSRAQPQPTGQFSRDAESSCGPTEAVHHQVVGVPHRRHRAGEIHQVHDLAAQQIPQSGSRSLGKASSEYSE